MVLTQDANICSTYGAFHLALFLGQLFTEKNNPEMKK